MVLGARAKVVPPTGELDRLSGSMGGFSFIHPIAPPSFEVLDMFMLHKTKSLIFSLEKCVYFRMV